MSEGVGTARHVGKFVMRPRIRELTLLLVLGSEAVRGLRLVLKYDVVVSVESAKIVLTYVVNRLGKWGVGCAGGRCPYCPYRIQDSPGRAG